MIDRKQVVEDALQFRRPAYVPWAWTMTAQCARRVRKHLDVEDLAGFVASHFRDIRSPVRRYDPVDANHVRDTYGVVWDRSIDEDIGTPVDWPLKKPEDLDRYEFPDAHSDDVYVGVAADRRRHSGLFCRFRVGLALYERAWTLRGMSDLLMDMIERPEFVERLLDAIADHNLVQIHKALPMGFDAFHFGDDYGMQTGLIMGREHWRHFIKPRLARMFEPIRDAGKYIFMHSCGKVTELLDDLIEIGLTGLDPFQPEVMDVFDLLERYRGRLTFHGGMSIQKVLPFGTTDEVRCATRRLIEAGRLGGYILAPAHAVPRDVPPENLCAMMDVLTSQAEKGVRTLL